MFNSSDSSVSKMVTVDANKTLIDIGEHVHHIISLLVSTGQWEVTTKTKGPSLEKTPLKRSFNPPATVMALGPHLNCSGPPDRSDIDV